MNKLHIVSLQRPWEKPPEEPTTAVSPKVHKYMMPWYTSGFT